ncbi:MAG: NUDIX domain-containing protein [Candidatus Portnoybacteria bacterium]|nr:NUDIX domain-containing protein [Candidatus Portnoybacteria bacterium]
MKKSIIVVSGPVIIENGKVLLNKHGDDNFWKFLGGRVENSDFKKETGSLEEACRREAKEEMGFDIKIVRPLKPMMVSKSGDPNAQVVLIHYLAERLGKINLGADIKEAKWFSVNDLPPDCAPNIKPVVAEYLKQK